MNDGGQAEEETDNANRSVIRSGAGSYSREIARISVAQICEAIGFEGFKESALDSLADIAIRYISNLGKISKFHANLAGRAESNVFDVAQGLKDLSLPQGFSGNSNIHTDCKFFLAVVTDIMHYVETSQEVPFAQLVQKFPVVRERKGIPSFSQIGDFPSFKHVPPWLPELPDPHTYIRTPVWNERLSNLCEDKIELAKQHRKAKRSLLSLQQRLLCNESSSSLDGGKAGNQFLASPLQNVETKVSLLNMFAPAIKSMRDGSLDSGSDREKIAPERRGKMVFDEPLELSIRNKAESWFGLEDERGDKKRRVEFIIRQSLENQQELSGL
ncbi:Transcription initiation factor TFIID subunit 8 [Striga hermonthica]|uniref:Transcription initiation factor TFIID subunit 8 n=1 Tax=Striga hermonthica TaxID=68872 RepID=A0A9N7RIW6_STRHE|nr:Transcription initiation factor TFIID subunit 8 [Striga hermonthica]